jgi:hypothetical protein
LLSKYKCYSEVRLGVGEYGGVSLVDPVVDGTLGEIGGGGEDGVESRGESESSLREELLDDIGVCDRLSVGA